MASNHRQTAHLIAQLVFRPFRHERSLFHFERRALRWPVRVPIQVGVRMASIDELRRRVHELLPRGSEPKSGVGGKTLDDGKGGAMVSVAE